MKKWLVVVIGLVVIPAMVFAASNSAFSIMGDAGRTVKGTLTDTARTIDNVVGTGYDKGGNHPIAALITVETFGARIAFGGVTPTVGDVGHVIAAGSSIRVSSPTMVGSTKLVNAVAGDNSVVQITLEY